MPVPSVVEAQGLRVSYPSRRGAVEALKGLDLRIGEGSLFVLLGPNGAGKTTLMRCITSLARPAGGGIRVLGEDAGTPAARPRRLGRIGVLIENPGAYGRLSAREYLSFFGSFYGSASLEARIRELCGAFGLALDGKRVSALSQGNRQKLQLARSLLHSPELLLWDEPTDHLDPEAQAQVLGYLRSYLAAGGRTALIATHRLEQMEALGTHFGFLREGRLLRSGTRDEILGGEAPEARVAFADPLWDSASDPSASKSAEAPSSWRPARAPEALQGVARGLGLSAEPEGPRAAVFAGPGLEAALPSLVRGLVLAGFRILAVEPLRPGLAEVYRKVMAA